MKTLRIDHVTVATPDAARAQATFARFFGLGQATSAVAGGAALTIGDARIEFVTPAAGSALAAAMAANGEGMAALCLEVASLDEAAERLRKGGVRFTAETSPAGRVMLVDQSEAHGVRLTLVEQRIRTVARASHSVEK